MARPDSIMWAIRLLCAYRTEKMLYAVTGGAILRSNHKEQTNMEDDNKLSFFFLGLGLGVAVGILFAPKSGEETRQMIRSKAAESGDYLKRRSSELADSAGDLLDKSKGAAGDLLDRGKGVLGRQKDQLNAAVEAGKQAYREAVGTPADRNVGSEGY
jgi:gas vesicle protein